MSSGIITFPRGNSLIERVDDFWKKPDGNTGPKIFRSKTKIVLDINYEKLTNRSKGYTVKELRNYMNIINSTHGEKIKDNGKVGIREQLIKFMDKQSEY